MNEKELSLILCLLWLLQKSRAYAHYSKYLKGKKGNGSTFAHCVHQQTKNSFLMYWKKYQMNNFGKRIV